MSFLLPSFPSGVVTLPFHACLVSILFSGPFLDDASDFVAVKRSLRWLTDWIGLGLRLGMDFAVLKRIAKSHSNKVEKCKTAMLHAWLKTGTATKDKLVTALRLMGEVSIVDKV